MENREGETVLIAKDVTIWYRTSLFKKWWLNKWPNSAGLKSPTKKGTCRL